MIVRLCYTKTGRQVMKGRKKRRFYPFLLAVLVVVAVLLLRPPCSFGESAPSHKAINAKTQHSAFRERTAEREEMVRDQIERGPVPIKDKAVLAAMRTAPRHFFVPHSLRESAYADIPLPIGYGQTISQPYMVAFMTEALMLKANEKVLEIGTGSGYQAAVLAAVTPKVYTIEIIAELAREARQRFKLLGFNTIEAATGDGYYGWKEFAPYDAIIVTCASGHVPPALVEQLKPGGRIVIPIGGVYQVQMLMLLTKDDQGAMKSTQLAPVRFVPMLGTGGVR